MKDEGGYTLIEILAGVLILGIVLTVFFQFFIFSQKTTTDNKEQLVTLRIAESVLEGMISDKTVFQDELEYLDIDGVLVPKENQIYECNGNEPYEDYKVKITIGEEQGGLGIYYVTVKVYGKGKQASEVKGLVEL